MGKPTDLEMLRELFQDNRVWLSIGKILVTEYAKDKSVLRAKVRLLNQPAGGTAHRDIIARMAWGLVGGYGPITPDDLVLVGIPEGDDDLATVICRYSSKEDLIPAQVVAGHSFIGSLPGKFLYLASGEKVLIGKGGAVDPDEPLVLGNVLKAHMTALYDAILDAPYIGIGPTGPVTLSPTLRAALIAQKSQYVTTAGTNFVSQVAFTERGD